jgi:hypothetical protein
MRCDRWLAATGKPAAGDPARNPAGRFPVQFLIFVLSQKLAGAAFHGLGRWPVAMLS